MKAVGTMSAEAFRFGDGEVLHSRYRIEFVGTVCGQGGGVWVQRGGWCVPSFVLPLWVHAAGGDH